MSSLQARLSLSLALAGVLASAAACGGSRYELKPMNEATYDASVECDFKPIYFAANAAEIRPSEVPRIKTLAGCLRRATKQVIISGHADRIGAPSYKQMVSQRRADAVRAELVRQGVMAEILVVEALGKTQPACTDKGEHCERLNRRVELRFSDLSYGF